MLAIASVFATGATAQTIGTVHYKETISFDIPLEGEAAQFAAMLPKEQKIEHVLYFSPEATMFQAVAKKEAPIDKQAQGIQIRMDAPEEKYYTNVRDGQCVNQREFFGRKFLVTGATEKQSWKMTGKQKTILNYPCQEAMLYGTDTVVAWFTTSIPVSSGPRGLHGLPGMILEAKHGRQSTMVATAVAAGGVPAGAITAPKSGKKVTDKQFKTIVDEKMAEMGAARDAGGNQVLIKVRHN